MAVRKTTVKSTNSYIKEIARFGVTEEQAKRIQARANAQAGDIIFFVADKPKLVYDIMGRCISSEKLGSNFTYNTKNLNSGVYIIEFKSNQASKQEKLIIQK